MSAATMEEQEIVGSTYELAGDYIAVLSLWHRKFCNGVGCLKAHTHWRNHKGGTMGGSLCFKDFRLHLHLIMHMAGFFGWNSVQ
jgi:hypothetical protein